MNRTSLHLLAILFWLILLRGLLVAQNPPRVEHTQGMHQHILREAAALLEREDPGMYMRIREHLGTQEAGGKPWEIQTVMAGAWREDLEDIAYGFGGTDPSLQPQIDINTPGGCLDPVYDDFRDYIANSDDVREGLVTISHFWDTEASDNYIGKDGIAVNATGLLQCLSTPNQTVTIKAPVNAWDKVQKLFRPMGTAILDRWWTERDDMYDAQNNLVCILPVRSSQDEVLKWKYNTLVDLYNTGSCAIMFPGQTQWVDVVLTARQRKQYVWQILGRICHLLADMSVPAHTHKDMHMGNLSVSEDVDKWGVKIGTVTISVQDEDSYETWIGNELNRFWTAEWIRDGLLDISSVQDPLHFLMSSVRDLAASFASDDADGTGIHRGMPRYMALIPRPHNLPPGQLDIIKHSMMCNIRDNTLPYTIRATATLLRWFVSQLQMPASFEVRNVGAAGYDDFFQRDRFNLPFPGFGMVSGTVFSKSVGEELSLRSHSEPHKVTAAKFRFWSDDQHGTTTKHQFDDYVAEGQSLIRAEYRSSEVYQSPLVTDRDEIGTPLHTTFPTFRNPWRIYANQTTEWGMVQPDIFEEYFPQKSVTSNGGMFINAYDPSSPEKGYYSIRASKKLESASLDHKTDPLAVGDFAFTGWEAIDAELYEDPRDLMNPRDPSYPAPEEYHTRIVDFTAPHAIVNAQYKAHRSAVRVAAPPTRINSQRKVAKDASTAHHAVYESSGRIWYVASTDHGATWSGETQVSERGVQATRPSIAACGSTAWVSYVADGLIVLRVLAGRGWQTVYSAPVAMAQDAVPVVAVLDDYEGCTARGPVIAVVWEDVELLKFAVLSGTTVLVDDEVLTRGYRRPTSVDQPRYPSIAASTMPYTTTGFDHGFHIAWIENGSIFYCRLGVDRSGQPARVTGWSPGSTVTRETVHARTGSVGALYPARHAPSVAVTERGSVHVAFDVVSSWSPWPGIGVAPGAKSTFTIRERALPSLAGPAWNTTATIVSTGNTGPGLCSPTLGAKPSAGVKGAKTASLRIAYNDTPGLVNVARIDGVMDIRPHEDGLDPSMTVWSDADDGLLDVFSADASLPYDWRVLASSHNLSREGEGRMLRQRQILLTNGESRAALGISDPRLTGDVGDERSLDWDPAHDSLLLGVTASCDEKMRSEVFVPSTGELLRMDIECFGEGTEESRGEVLLRVHDAGTHEALRTVSLPVQGFASAAAVATQDMDLSSLAGTALYFTADVNVAGESWTVAVADRYARVEAGADGAVAKDRSVPVAVRPVLHQNHPNPFNPSTAITFSLREAARVRLSVFNLLGVEVAVLEDGRLSAGRHERRFSGNDLPSGVYVYRLEAAGHTLTRSMHLVK